MWSHTPKAIFGSSSRSSSASAMVSASPPSSIQWKLAWGFRRHSCGLWLSASSSGKEWAHGGGVKATGWSVSRAWMRSEEPIAESSPSSSGARALAQIGENLSGPWGVAQPCEAPGAPQLRLERHFSAELGRTPGAEILRQRLARAKALLLETEMPLAEVAARCGFCNASYLSNLFRRETGLAPRAWRKAAGRG